ncbi:MAG: hypothetical protein QM674_16720 [Burkholderiaceae bacterium]
MDSQVRKELAASAARWIADGGLDYGAAKQRAVRELFGDARAPRAVLPDNEQIDEALREHLALFDDGHAERVERMRRVTLALMDELADFSPLATGAVWKGLATEHAPIHLQLFPDNAKDVPIHLINRRVDYDAVTVPHFRTGEDVEAFACLWHEQPVLLSVYGEYDLRGALKPVNGVTQRGDRRAPARLMETAS